MSCASACLHTPSNPCKHTSRSCTSVFQAYFFSSHLYSSILPLACPSRAFHFPDMAQKLHPKIAEMRAHARMNTVGFESGGMPKRMQGTKANNLDDYKSRFETMGLGTGGSSASSSTMQSKARAFADKALALGEAAGMGGARVPLVADAAKTMEKMMDKFINSKVARHQESDAARKKKGVDGKKDKKRKKEKKASKKKDKKTKSDAKKKKKSKKKKKKVRKKKKSDEEKRRKRKHPGGSSGESSSSSPSASPPASDGASNGAAPRGGSSSSSERRRSGREDGCRRSSRSGTSRGEDSSSGGAGERGPE